MIEFFGEKSFQSSTVNSSCKKNMDTWEGPKYISDRKNHIQSSVQ